MVNISKSVFFILWVTVLAMSRGVVLRPSYQKFPSGRKIRKIFRVGEQELWLIADVAHSILVSHINLKIGWDNPFNSVDIHNHFEFNSIIINIFGFKLKIKFT